MFRIKRHKNSIILVLVIFFSLPGLCHAEGLFDRIWQNRSQIQELPGVKGFTYNLKRLLEVVREHIKKIDEEIKDGEIRKRNEEREARIREHFEKGNQFYAQGQLKEAKAEWLEVLEIAKEPEMKKYVHESHKWEKQQEPKATAAEPEERLRLQAQESSREMLERGREQQRQTEEKHSFEKAQKQESCSEAGKRLQVALALCEQEKQLQQQKLRRLEENCKVEIQGGQESEKRHQVESLLDEQERLYREKRK
jgi:hypothetical protein